MLPSIFHKAANIISIIEEHHYEAYFVGGCVRDYIIGRPIHDVDIASSAFPSEIQAIFPKVIPVGIEHGTVIVRYEQESFEVTTYRTEGTYTDHRRPDEVHFVRDIKEDLKRRDFTMNAIAMDANGKVLDPFGGREDIAGRRIQTVGDAADRFKEDALRIIRALRFSSQLGFSIEVNTKEAMKSCRALIDKVAVERLTVELEKLCAGAYFSKAVEYIFELELYHHLPIFKDTPLLLKEIEPVASLAPVFAFVELNSESITAADCTKAYKCSNQLKQQANTLVDAYHRYKENGIDAWFVYQLPRKQWDFFIYLVKQTDKKIIDIEVFYSIRKKLPILSKKELCVNGYDLMKWFPERPKGKWIKQQLDAIEYQIVTSKLANEKSKIKDWIQWNLPVQD
ncbi:CCA tRNA nucleotidyltransferase [Oceanobacillus oncorhynchi]|uniref:CCA tRNA nucleotidyltransferase n=1 Tax=Oceanobacillus oncorhynchi TaxID=545501 RepID=UPI0021168D6E|nr:CCA tRNA nucleotidyltransferase [Oceanobacillus oncorhynchi]UUI38075.1 CCA tRNA nucleotidyltransferase [Oceanobacillus oncorhynchi]